MAEKARPQIDNMRTRRAEQPPVVLVLEDEIISALDIQDFLEGLGCHVLGPFALIADARRAWRSCDTPLHRAFLDVDVVDGTSYALAEELKAQGVPVTFVTAQGKEAKKRVDSADIVDKPWREAALRERVAV